MNDIRSDPSALTQEIDALQQQREEIDSKIRQAREALNGWIVEAPLTADDAWYLYWHEPLIRAESIAAGLRLAGHDVRSGSGVCHFVGPGPVAAVCSRCGGPWRRTSRSSEKPGDRRFDPVCGACRKLQFASSETRWRDQQERERMQVKMLCSMPYSEYLQTDHWQEKRRQALRRAHYRCQLCNSGDRVLNVHHRTYERRGEEIAADLIVLCRECHAHHHGKPV